MAMAESFRNQHAEMLRLAKGILSEVERDPALEGADQIRTLLSRLSGTLKVHLAMEDKVLYPKMLAASDGAVSGQAKRFMDEMSGIEQLFRAYATKWATGRLIQGGAADFAAETKKLFAALAARIERENTQLYPLADSL